MFVIANPTGGMVDRLATAAYGDTEWINTPWTVSVEGNQTEGAIWSSTNGGNFLMTNSQIAVRDTSADVGMGQLHIGRQVFQPF